MIVSFWVTSLPKPVINNIPPTEVKGREKGMPKQPSILHTMLAFPICCHFPRQNDWPTSLGSCNSKAYDTALVLTWMEEHLETKAPYLKAIVLF